MLKNKIKAEWQSYTHHRGCVMSTNFLILIPKCQKAHRLQITVSCTESPRLPLHSQDTLTPPLQEHLHTTARRATVLRVTTPGHLEQNHRKETNRCCWAPHPIWYFQSCSNTGKTRNAEFHVRHRAGMVICDAYYHSQKWLDAPLEPLRTHKENISQEGVSILGGHTQYISELQL